MKKIITILFLLPLFAMAQTFGGFTIQNETKATITAGASLKITNITGNSVLWLSGEATPNADSLIIDISPLDSKPINLQLRVSASAKTEGKVVTLTSAGRQAIPLSAFNVASPSAIRIYNANANKAGYEITAIGFVPKYVPPTVKPPLVAAINEARIIFLIDSILKTLPINDTFKLDFGKGFKVTSTGKNATKIDLQK